MKCGFRFRESDVNLFTGAISAARLRLRLPQPSVDCVEPVFFVRDEGRGVVRGENVGDVDSLFATLRDELTGSRARGENTDQRGIAMSS